MKRLLLTWMLLWSVVGCTDVHVVSLGPAGPGSADTDASTAMHDASDGETHDSSVTVHDAGEDETGDPSDEPHDAGDDNGGKPKSDAGDQMGGDGSDNDASS